VCPRQDQLPGSGQVMACRRAAHMASAGHFPCGSKSRDKMWIIAPANESPPTFDRHRLLGSALSISSSSSGVTVEGQRSRGRPVITGM
jgi:hypothetical protein